MDTLILKREINPTVIFSAALAEILNPELTIEFRKPSEEDFLDDDVYILEQKLDPQFRDQQNQENQYGPFGLLLKKYGFVLMPESEVLSLDRAIGMEIDRTYVERKPTALFSILNEISDEDNDFEAAFNEGKAIAKRFFEMRLKHIRERKSAVPSILKAIETAEDNIVVMDKYYSNALSEIFKRQNTLKDKVKFLIYPNKVIEGTFVLQLIGWDGVRLNNRELKTNKDVAGCIFASIPSGILVFNSIEEAKKASKRLPLFFPQRIKYTSEDEEKTVSGSDNNNFNDDTVNEQPHYKTDRLSNKFKKMRQRYSADET
jgi:hypothetical protein